MNLKMHYKHIIVVLLIFLNSCVNYPTDKKIETKQSKNYFLNKGFALVYNDDLYKKKLINAKIENRSLIIFQRNLKENSIVKITNLINSKYIITKVGKRAEYPFFYNSVISQRISQELEIKSSLINKAIAIVHKGSYQNLSDDMDTLDSILTAAGKI